MVLLTKRKRIARRPDKAWQTKELLQMLMPTKGKSKRKTLSLTIAGTFRRTTKTWGTLTTLPISYITNTHQQS